MLKDWINRRHGRIRPHLHKIYIIEPPRCTEEVNEILRTTGSGLLNDEDKSWSNRKPKTKDIADYVRAYYYGVEVEVIDLDFEICSAVVDGDKRNVALELRQYRGEFYRRLGYFLAFRPSILCNGTKREDYEWRILIPALASCLVRAVPDDAAFALTLVVRT
jgi:hypothetical protein